MVEFEASALHEHELVLEHDDVPVRADPPESQDLQPMIGRVRFGGPDSVPLSIDSPLIATDPGLRAFVTAMSKTHEYHLVQAAVTFLTQPGEPALVQGGVAMTLTSPGGNPKVISMAPRHVVHPVQRTRTFRLGPELSVFEMSVGLASIGTTVDFVKMDPVLTALGLWTDRPGWQFTKTEAMGIEGTHPLMLVVQLYRGHAASVETTVSATIRRRQLLWYRSKPLGPMSIRSTVSGENA